MLLSAVATLQHRKPHCTSEYPTRSDPNHPPSTSTSIPLASDMGMGMGMGVDGEHFEYEEYGAESGVMQFDNYMR